MNRAKIVSFINYKGGVGKTTTTYHIGCGLAHYHQKRVLLVDIDPQTNLTFLCVDYDSWLRFKGNNGTIADLYRNFVEKKAFQTTRCIWQEPVGRDRGSKIKGLDLLPCDLDLLGEDLGGASSTVILSADPEAAFRRTMRDALRQWLFLKQVFSQVQDKYDYILIDCPPNLYLMTQNALVASDWYVVTTIPEYLSVVGLRILTRKVDEIRKKIIGVAHGADNKDIAVAELGGIIFVKVRVGGSLVTQQHVAQMNEVISAFPDKCFQYYTTELIGYSEAAESRLPVWLADTSNARRVARTCQYQIITREFLERFS